MIVVHEEPRFIELVTTNWAVSAITSLVSAKMVEDLDKSEWRSTADCYVTISRATSDDLYAVLYADAKGIRFISKTKVSEMSATHLNVGDSMLFPAGRLSVQFPPTGKV